MSSQTIPEPVRAEAERIVARFNRDHFPDPARGYRPRFRGRYRYLDRPDLGVPVRITDILRSLFRPGRRR